MLRCARCATRSRPSPPSRPPATPSGGEPSPASSPPAAPGDGSDLIETLNALSAKHLAQVAKTARAEGLEFPNARTPHEVHRLKQIIDGVVNQF